jgi:hypothetical protein
MRRMRLGCLGPTSMRVVTVRIQDDQAQCLERQGGKEVERRERGWVRADEITGKIVEGGEKNKERWE